jgi:hypothetical protein
MAINRTVEGLLVRQQTGGFDTADWSVSGGGSLSLASGNLRVSVPSNTIQKVMFDDIAPRDKFFISVLIRTVTTGGDIGAIVSEDGDDVSTFVRIPTYGASSFAIIDDTGVFQDLAESSPQAYTVGTFYRNNFWMHNKIVHTLSFSPDHNIFGFRRRVADEGKAGWTVASLNPNNGEISDFIVCSDKYVKVYAPVPDGYTVDIMDSLGTTVLFTATFEGGLAILDVIDNPDVAIIDGEIIIRDLSSTIVDQSGTITIWPGDIFGTVINPVRPSALPVRSELTILRLDDSSLISFVNSAAFVWEYPFGTLPVLVLLQGQVVYYDIDDNASLPSNIVIFIIPFVEPPVVTPCTLTTPTLIEDSNPEDLPVMFGENCGQEVVAVVPFNEENTGEPSVFEPCP